MDMNQKVFLHGHGRIENQKQEQNQGQNMPQENEGVNHIDDNEGISHIDDKDPEFSQDVVEYGGGIDLTPMEELLNEDKKEIEKLDTENDKNNVITNRSELPISSKSGFDDTVVQDARIDSDIEGGVTNPMRSTGPMKFNGDYTSEGGIIGKRDPIADSTPGAFELSGFHVEMETDSGMVSIQVTQDFHDIETAKMSINGDKFLMPLKSGGFKVCRITRGAPIICNNERMLLEYIDGKWRRP